MAYGYKNHVTVDRRHKLVRRYQVTDAAVHVVEDILDPDNTASDVWADSAYRSAEIEAKLKEKGLNSRIHRKGHRDKPLSEREKRGNKARSKVRARSGPRATRDGSIGLVRARARIAEEPRLRGAAGASRRGGANVMVIRGEVCLEPPLKRCANRTTCRTSVALFFEVLKFARTCHLRRKNRLGPCIQVSGFIERCPAVDSVRWTTAGNRQFRQCANGAVYAVVFMKVRRGFPAPETSSTGHLRITPGHVPN